MAYSEAQNKANQRYHKKNYDQLSIRVPKGKREEYKRQAEEKGFSLASYIVHLLENDK